MLPPAAELFEMFLKTGSGGLMRLFELLFSWYSVIDSGFFSVAAGITGISEKRKKNNYKNVILSIDKTF